MENPGSIQQRYEKNKRKNRKNNRQDRRRKNNNRRRLECKNGKGRPLFNEERKEFERRNSKDKVKNIEGTKLIEMVEENGWEILNGNTKGDEAGEFRGGKETR